MKANAFAIKLGTGVYAAYAGYSGDWSFQESNLDHEPSAP